MLRSGPFRRSVATLKEVQSCQEYLDYCRLKGTALDCPVFKGTLYELTTKHLLEKSLNCFKLLRVGGAGDNGLDLFGRWDLSNYQDAPEKKPSKILLSSLLLLCKPYSSLKNALNLLQDVVVLVQCKNHRLKIKASTIRELAGIREFNINMRSKSDRRKTFMVLASPLPMTKQAASQIDTSDVPMLHAQISPLTAPPLADSNAYNFKNWTGGVLGPVYLNFASRTVLQGLNVERKFGEVVR